MTDIKITREYKEFDAGDMIGLKVTYEEGGRATARAGSIMAIFWHAMDAQQRENCWKAVENDAIKWHRGEHHKGDVIKFKPGTFSGC